MGNEVAEIKKGDVVELKSGGPKMTVDFENNGAQWNCKWFDGAELKQGNFDITSLRKAE